MAEEVVGFVRIALLEDFLNEFILIIQRIER